MKNFHQKKHNFHSFLESHFICQEAYVRCHVSTIRFLMQKMKLTRVQTLVLMSTSDQLNDSVSSKTSDSKKEQVHGIS